MVNERNWTVKPARRRRGRVISFVGALSVFLAGMPGFAVPAAAAAAPPSASLTQCANGKASGAEQPCSWVTGNLNPHANSQYREGDSVPFRTELGRLVPTHVYLLDIEWDTIEGDDVAYDFLTTWDCSESGAPATNPPAAGAPTSTIAIPNDPRMTNAGVADQTGGCGTKDLTMWGGTLTGVSYQYSDGGSTTDPYPATSMKTTVTVTFEATAADATLAWGGHIARRVIWNPLGYNTASQDRPNASPYHFSLGGTLFDDTDKATYTVGKGDRSLKPIAAVPAFEFTKVASATTVAPSTTFDYTLTATNTGDADAGPWTISDKVRAELTVVSVTPDNTDPANGCALTGNDVSCQFTSLTALSSQVVTIEVKAPAACGVFDNTATFTHDTTTIDAAVDVTVDPCDIALTATKTAAHASLALGAPTSWTVTATNGVSATIPATGVVVTDTVDDMFNTITASYSLDGGATSTACGVAGQVVTCSVGDLAPNASAVVTINAVANAAPDPAAGAAQCDTTNTAAVMADHLTTPLTTPQTATKVLDCLPDVPPPPPTPPTPPTTPPPTAPQPAATVLGDPGILVQKSADQSLVLFDPEVEQVVNYTYVVVNTGAVTLTDVTVDDDVLGAISLPTTTLEPGDKITGSATHVVTEADAEARSIVNVATATGTDPDGGFIQSIDSVTVQVDPPADVLGVVEERPDPEPEPEPIPAPEPAEVLPQVEEELPATGTSTSEAGSLALLMLMLGALLVYGSRLPNPNARRV